MPAYYLEAFAIALGISALMLEAFGSKNNKTPVAYLCIGGLSLIFIALFFSEGPTNPEMEKWPIWERFYTFDSQAKFFKGLVLLCAILVLLMASDFRKILAKFTDNPKTEDGTGEYYSLIVLATSGMMWMASAKDLISIFCALELTTISFYILVGFMRRNVGSIEAAVKYLILGALSTGFLVYGIAWIYGATGTTHLDSIQELLNDSAFLEAHSKHLLFGVSLLLISIGFKVGAVPMQIWIPDVYQGAPTPTTTFLSVASKAAGFAIALRIITPFIETDFLSGPLSLIISIMAAATLLYGNLAAIGQNNFKRLLAYSSIAHAGFLMLGIAAWNSKTIEGNLLSSADAIKFYLATYLMMTVGAFFIVALVRRSDDSEEISSFDGLGKRNPMLAAALTVFMAAMAGIPLTAGFWGKLFIFQLAVSSQMWSAIFIAFVGVAAGFYYYLKVVKAMYWNNPKSETAVTVPMVSGAIIAILAITTLILGIWAQPIHSLLN